MKNLVVVSTIDGFTGGFNPPDASSYLAEKVPAPLEKNSIPQVGWHFHEIKVLEGVSEHKNI